MIKRRRFMSSSGFDGLTFEILESGNIYWKFLEREISSGHPQFQKTIQYSKNGGSWTNITATSSPGTAIPVVSGDILRFKGELNGTFYYDDTYIFMLNFASSCNFIAYGKVESITGSGNCGALFGQCDKLNMTQEKKVVLPVLSSGVTNHYTSMFGNCTALNVVPEIPLTLEGIAPVCEGMFENCTSLTAAPSLPATALTEGCYQNMFRECTSLTAAPSLPATTLAVDCYKFMFDGCISLTAAPSLPATTLAESCYYSMFDGCISLTAAPSLPATTLAEECYGCMFHSCTSLTAAPSLPASRLQPYCYYGMFHSCTSLTAATSLSATILAESCCYSMFQGCTSLTTAPTLYANTLVNSCYSFMFNGCSNLSKINCRARVYNTLELENCTFYWVTNVKSSGQITITPDLNLEWRSILTTGSGLPPGWTVKVA